MYASLHMLEMLYNKLNAPTMLFQRARAIRV